MMTDACSIKGRFAPSPSGEMHAGNIFASLIAWLVSKLQGGSIVLRIENLDPQRSKQEYAEKILFDYERLGLYWDEGPFFQDDNTRYDHAFRELELLELVYPCFCTRADLKAASAPHADERRVYQGTCRDIPADTLQERLKKEKHAWRIKTVHDSVCFSDILQGEQNYDVNSECGDFVVKRSDGVYAYQLAVVIDDAQMGITSVVRGADLLGSTPQQMILQSALGYAHPQYCHVPLFVDKEGRRLSKRHKDAEVDSLVSRFGSSKAVIGYIAYISGLIEEPESISPNELLQYLSYECIVSALHGKRAIVWE